MLRSSFRTIRLHLPVTSCAGVVLLALVAACGGSGEEEDLDGTPGPAAPRATETARGTGDRTLDATTRTGKPPVCATALVLKTVVDVRRPGGGQNVLHGELEPACQTPGRLATLSLAVAGQVLLPAAFNCLGITGEYQLQCKARVEDVTTQGLIVIPLDAPSGFDKKTLRAFLEVQ